MAVDNIYCLLPLGETFRCGASINKQMGCQFQLHFQTVFLQSTCDTHHVVVSNWSFIIYIYIYVYIYIYIYIIYAGPSSRAV